MTTNTVASTILQQLGGNRFLAMTGARYLVATSNALQFTLSPRLTKHRINSVVVRLDANDTYTLLFNRRKGVDITLVDSANGIYADQLRGVFTDATGLVTSL
jgi:hypothetical protein